MSERSLLRIRSRPHVDKTRREDEWIVEVWRGAEVVATIYGTREGVQIHSERFTFEPMINKPFGVMVNDMASIVVPLLAVGEECPWCSGTRIVMEKPCPLCQ